MEIKVGQWVRYLKNDGKLKFKQMSITLNAEDLTIPLENIIKVADTPHELVAVGDLVEVLYQHNNKVLPLTLVTDYNDEFVFTLNAVVRKERIVSIYTPNADKTQYTEQWRSGNE